MIVPIYNIGEETDPLLIGGKAASLSRMQALGLPVPPGIVIGIRAWELWKAEAVTVEEIWRQAKRRLVQADPDWETHTVSVRSGAPVSMPGMMDTILHVGRSDSAALRMKLAVSYTKAMGAALIEDELDEFLVYNGVFFVSDLDNSDNVYGIDNWLEKFPVPGMNEYGTVEDLDALMQNCILQVFRSWDSPRAIDYRKAKGIPDDLGTAVTIQRMVDARYGGSGVMLTRGDEDGPTIQWVERLQGDAVVDGSSHVQNLTAFRRWHKAHYDQLIEAGRLLESTYRDAMDVEFTFDNDQLYFLQCRPAKRTPQEAMRIAVQLYDDHVIEKEELAAVPRVPYDYVSVEVHGGEYIGQGSIIHPKLVTAPFVVSRSSPDRILWTSEMSTDLITAMRNSLATITKNGGVTCHAALVARELGLTCVVGAGFGLRTGSSLHSFRIGSAYEDSDPITILPDGRIFAGEVTVEETRQPTEWASRYDGLLDGTVKRKRRRPQPKKDEAETLNPKDEDDPEASEEYEYTPF